MLYNSIMAGSYTVSVSVTLRSLTEWTVQMPVEEWEGISDLAKDLISKLLVVDASKRLTPAEVAAALEAAEIR